MIPSGDMQDLMRPTKAVIDLGAVAYNIAQVRSLVGEKIEILAVVKADAYGHGAQRVARACERSGTSMLGVALVGEGVKLRLAGIRLPILVQCCASDAEIDAALEHDLTLTVVSRESTMQLSRKASEAGITANVHVDIDTGMGRIGFDRKTAVEEIAEIGELPNINIDGIYTHFSTSEIENDPHTLNQLHLFEELVNSLSGRGIRPLRIHAANSGAVINYPQAHLTLVRPGLILYGVYPHAKLRPKIDLRPALRFETSIAFMKDIAAGTSLGYGRSFVAHEPMRIATANVGYADGYPWRMSNKSAVIVHGKRVPVVGRVSMDQLLIDVTSVPEATIGDTITLLGRDGDEWITAEEAAEWAGTISYEILCGISKRVPRIHVET